MCGIAGVFSPRRGVRIDPALLQTMARGVAHRGPDDRGSFVDEGVGFAFCRLSIIDLATGNQPHSNEDGTITSVCNGEIYNFRELRRELESKGHRFRTRCDVEVIVHLYEEHGADFVRRLNGQFAFALYDARDHALVLARDQAGIAPLFHAHCGEELLFASEIKALLQHPAMRRKVDLRGLDQILTFPGLVSPTTMFEGIRALAPGWILRADRDGVSTSEYWDLVYPERCDAIDGGLAAGQMEWLEELLFGAVRRRLQADVPVGIYLSGGLDSSLIGAISRSISQTDPFHSFSVTFSDAEIDERHYQRLIAGYLGSVHHEIEFTPASVISRLHQAVACAETPLKESYNTCSLALSALVRENDHKVVLTGEGADELFAGYVGYRLDAAGVRGGGADDGLERMLEDEGRERLWGDPAFFYERDYVAFAEAKAAIYSEAVAAQLSSFECTRESPIDIGKIRNRHPLHQRSYVDFKLRLADHLLADHADRVSYANAVEARYPFLDLDLIDFVRTLPPGLLMQDATEKFPLRVLAGKHLPPAVATREKFGFVAPGSPYLLTQNVDWIEELLSPERIRRENYFNPDTVERLRRRAVDGTMHINTTFDTDLLMLVLTFGIFLETFRLPEYFG
jgi:asparagine synthase (glutamine-hydrolysing)